MKTFICKAKNCPAKGKPQERILVISACTQTHTIGTDSYENLDVGETLYGACRECGKKIPNKLFSQLH